MYTVKAGAKESFPEFLALHGAKHLVDRELIRAGKIKQLNDTAARDELYGKILGKPTAIGKQEPSEPEIEVEEEFPELEKEPEMPPVDLSRKEMFAKVKALGLKARIPISNQELKDLISSAK